MPGKKLLIAGVLSFCHMSFFIFLLSFNPSDDMLFPGVLFAGVRMFTKRKVTPCRPDQNGGWMGKFTEPPFSVISPHPGVAGAVKRHIFHHELEADLVDTPTAILLCRQNMFCPRNIPCKKIKSQRVLAIGNRVHNSIDLRIREWNDWQKRRKMLMLHNAFINRNRKEDRRFKTPGYRITVATENDTIGVFCCFRTAFLIGSCGNQMRIFLVLQRICSDLFFKGVFQLGEERFCYFFSDCNLIDVDADLTAVAQLQECNFTRGILQVRVGADDAPVPGFSAKLQRNLEIIDAVDDLLGYYREKGLYDAYRAQLDYVAFYNMFLTGSVRVCLADPKSPVLPQLKEAFLARFPDFRENAYIRSMSKKHRLLTGLLLSGQYGAVAALMRLNDRLRNKNR